MSLTKSHLPIQQKVIVLLNHVILPIDIETPHKLILLALSMDNISPQPTSTAELRVPVLSKSLLSALPIDEMLNQPTPTILLGAALAPNKTMLSALPANEDKVPTSTT